MAVQCGERDLHQEGGTKKAAWPWVFPWPIHPAVPSSNQKTMSQIDQRGWVREFGWWVRGGLPIMTHPLCLWLIYGMIPHTQYFCAIKYMLSYNMLVKSVYCTAHKKSKYCTVSYIWSFKSYSTAPCLQTQQSKIEWYHTHGTTSHTNMHTTHKLHFWSMQLQMIWPFFGMPWRDMITRQRHKCIHLPHTLLPYNLSSIVSYSTVHIPSKYDMLPCGHSTVVVQYCTLPPNTTSKKSITTHYFTIQ